MFKIKNKKAQAAAELAVFGAILIYLLGTIVRSAVGNSYEQNQNFKAMRMAMLASWRGSQAGNIGRNNASVIFIEDRLSPDSDKYGDLDRNPFVASGSGSFSSLMLYPIDAGEVSANVPITDMYINGQHFPFTNASYVMNRTITPPVCGVDGPYFPPPYGNPLTQAQCLQNQCLRNQREWTGGIVHQSQFNNIIPVSPNTPAAPGETVAQTVNGLIQNNASAILAELNSLGLIQAAGTNGTVTTLSASSASTQWASFTAWFDGAYPSDAQTQAAQINIIKNILKSASSKYKLFYTNVPNGTATFSPFAPTCSSHPCKDQELSNDVLLKDGQGRLILDGNGQPLTNSSADMQYDLLRNADYNSGDASSVESQFGPSVSSCDTKSQSLRCNIAWQWAATAATSATLIGLDANNQSYPSYDIDGRLKEQTIYALTQNSDGTPTVSYEDFQGGDIDQTWDTNSCSPKPGLQNDSQIYTFTKEGTYLLIKEGNLYNPETNLFVRSVNQRDTIDLVQRTIQLSNDTGRFCNGSTETPQPCIARCLSTPTICPSGGSINQIIQDTQTVVTGNGSCCTPTAANNYCNCTPATMNGSCTEQPGETAVPDSNPVEICIPPQSTDNCFTSANIGKTCFDENDNRLFVRSRLEDRRGNFWMTNTSGQLKVQ